MSTIIIRRQRFVVSAVLIFAWLCAGSTSYAAESMREPVREHPRREPPLPGAPDGFRNLFHAAKTQASEVAPYHPAHFATSWGSDDPDGCWGSRTLPASLTVVMSKTETLNTIRLLTRWLDRPVFQYVIEGSLDGKSWSMLVDRHKNTNPATERGETFYFPPQAVRYVRTTFTGNSKGKDHGAQIVEIEGYHLPQEQITDARAWKDAWREVPAGLHAAIASKDIRYPRCAVPVLENKEEKDHRWSTIAWRGERVATQAVAWSRDGFEGLRILRGPLRGPLRGSNEKEIPASAVRCRFVRYVLSGRTCQTCGSAPLRETHVVPDVLDLAQRLDLAPCTVRPVWISIDVPPQTPPGRYRGELVVKANGGKSIPLAIELEVLPAVLPPPSQWSFWLNVWQHPWSVAEYHGVEPWSEAHMTVLRPHLKMLAEAGQKCARTTILEPRMSGQYTPLHSMVKWIRGADGKFRFDYTIFDKYVELAAECGISKGISCFGIFPRKGRGCVGYLDEASGDYVWNSWSVGSKEHEEFWKVFLADFSKHLKKKGWFEKTALIMDESKPVEARAHFKTIREAAPGLKVAWSGHYHEEFKDEVANWCFYVGLAANREVIAQRKRSGKTTTFYVACDPVHPNIHTFSPPAEATWMAWHAAAMGYDGFLFWAYDNWNENPLFDTRWVRFPAGDMFLIYPGPRSSIRFERLREGIQDFEKLCILRKQLKRQNDAEATAALTRLNKILEQFSYQTVQKTPASETVREAQKLLEELSGKVPPAK
ncbi:MAG: DUF4091 domain-containing protein [Pirellulales bacterium]|nr:DUF4091 domain-containing protein [Pirellulales bacterium]